VLELVHNRVADFERQRHDEPYLLVVLESIGEAIEFGDVVIDERPIVSPLRVLATLHVVLACIRNSDPQATAEGCPCVARSAVAADIAFIVTSRITAALQATDEEGDGCPHEAMLLRARSLPQVSPKPGTREQAPQLPCPHPRAFL
jgi:hypothetical protein